MKISAGTTAYIGPPANPFPKQISDAIGTALGKFPDILEAHLPNVYVKGCIDPPAQVLVVVLKDNTPSAKAKIMEGLSAALPPNCHLDIMELHPDDRTLPAIRASGTQLHLKPRAELSGE